MRERVIFRYSACFRQQVVAELESGRFGSIEAARRHYGIGGRQHDQPVAEALRTGSFTGKGGACGKAG